MNKSVNLGPKCSPEVKTVSQSVIVVIAVFGDSDGKLLYPYKTRFHDFMTQSACSEVFPKASSAL